MAKLSITEAWNETAEFVRREAGLLFPIAFRFSEPVVAANTPITVLASASPT